MGPPSLLSWAGDIAEGIRLIAGSPPSDLDGERHRTWVG
jgi:hypothetical protein